MTDLKVFYAHDFTQDRSAAAMSPTEDYVEFYLKSDVDALLARSKPKKKVKAKHSPLVERALCEMNDAIKDFGEYTYGDKGPYEVMDIDSLALDFRAFEPDAAAEALVELSKVNDNAESLASCLTGHLQEWDELFEFLPEDFVW